MVMKKYIAALALLLGLVEPALAQWQVPDHAVPIGRGPGFTGFKNAAPGTVGLPLVSNGAASDPSFQQTISTANKTLHVSTAGNDANDGLSWATAKLTLQAGLNAAATAGIVHVGAGTYTLTSALVMKPGVRLLCNDGAIITQGNSQNLTTMIDFFLADGGSIERCIVDGNRANNTDAEACCTVMVHMSSAADVSIKNNTLRNGTGYLIASNGLRPRIEDNSLSNFYQTGVFLSPASPNQETFGVIENNRITSVGSHAMFIAGDYNIVSHNIVVGAMIGAPGSILTVNTSGTTVTWVSGPNFATVIPGQFLVINGGQEFKVTVKASSTSLTVATTPGTLTGVPATIGSGDHIGVQDSSRSVISDNNMTLGATFGIAISSAGNLTTRNLLANNRIVLAGKACIDINATANVSKNSILGNYLYNCGQSQAGAGQQSGIQISHSTGSIVADTFIDGNTIMDDQGTPTTLSWLRVDSGANASNVIGKNSHKGTTNADLTNDIASITLSAGWGTTASTSAITSQGDSIQFTITSAGTGQAASPSFTVNKRVAVTANPPNIQCKFLTGTGALQAIWGEQQATAGQWIANYNGTPVAGSTYTINCGG
jgi:hypothetical protein